MILTLRKSFLVLACFFAALAAEAKKAESTDEIAESIARARSTEEIFDVTAPAAATAEESSDLQDMIGDAKLVASATGTANETASAATVPAEATSESDITAENKDGKTKETAQEIQAKAEKDIPVLGTKTKTAKSSGSAITRILFSLAVLCIALFATTVGLKRWAKRRQGKTQHTAIKILTQHFIGPKKSLAIVQVAGETILIGVTDQNITMLKSLALLDEEIPEQMPKNFDAALNNNNNDDIDFNGLNEIRDKVSRSLRTMKDL
jgi:flagellar protein FliO/FliZ